MAEQQPPPGFKNVALNKIMETITTELDSNNDHYSQFGITGQGITCERWESYTPGPAGHYIDQYVQSEPCNIQSLNSVATSLYMQDVPTYESSLLTNPIYLSPKSVNHIGVNENNGLIGTIDVGGGNYVNVIYGDASHIMAERYQLSNVPTYTTPNMIDHEYGLFHDQHSVVPTEVHNENFNGKQLIDNLVGNWVPNQSGTYSPFGGSTSIASQTKQENQQFEELPRNAAELQYKKPRMIAEVKPMRPSYSDILTKSAPVSSPSLSLSFSKPKVELLPKKVAGKNSKSKTKCAILKRQNSTGSDDHSSPKAHNHKQNVQKNNTNLPRRWVSLDNLVAQTESPDINTFDRSDDAEKRKKSTKRNEKSEMLNNTKLSYNCKNSGNFPNYPIQINNNLNTTNTSSQTVFPEKLEKNQSSLNKICKDEKKASKEKNVKRSQIEKPIQFRKAHRNRRKENRDPSVPDLFKNVNKYINRWSKIVLQIIYWLIHLISDVVSMSVNLVIQLGKCAWYHSILYLKYFWVYLAENFSKIYILKTFGQRLDTWFGNSKLAFWRKCNTKDDTKDENTHWLHSGLETNIALPSTGDEAMKRLLACKDKDPYSILGVTPSCSDDDIKKYYKRQAVLVHPDKNNQPGAEEAFKILVHAFDIIGEPERRQAFDQTRQVEAAWGELSDLLSQLHRKMEQAANTIRCTNCGLRHKRIPTQRPCYAARFCAQCKICHSAKEGDIWAESRIMGFLWHYYACMEGAVYDVTDWAACQAGNLKHLKANTHSVQYRIVLGQRPPPQTSSCGKKRQQMDGDTSGADFEDFLNNLYNHSKSGNINTSSGPNTFKGDCRRRKSKRKK